MFARSFEKPCNSTESFEIPSELTDGARAVYTGTRGRTVNPEDERPHAVGVRLANSEEFCQALLDDIEFHFRKQYGAKWTPELQEVFQDLRATVVTTARAADDGFRVELLKPLRAPVILSNGTRRG